MKKIALCLMTACMLLAFNPFQSMAATTAPSALVATTPTGAKEAKTLLLRLEVIKNMDKSNLTSVEKKSLRKEVRSIKTQLRESNGGVYLSVGAVIIILLLLIILL
ncbi:MAG: hypothetical protein HXX14_03780 [Bacteroidetes bacterium]|nr:hypothetical protein [Bacteroidota bacterium]